MFNVEDLDNKSEKEIVEIIESLPPKEFNKLLSKDSEISAHVLRTMAISKYMISAYRWAIIGSPAYYYTVVRQHKILKNIDKIGKNLTDL